jgi:hypothetical protein
MQPSFTWYVFLAGDKQILFDDGCCSRQVDNTGKCL